MDLRVVYFCAVFQVLAVTVIATTTGYDTSKAFVGRSGRRSHKIIYDDVTGVTAVKDVSTEKCYIRLPVKDKSTQGQRIVQHHIAIDQLLYVVGPKILKFCDGYSIYVITKENLNGFPAKSNIQKRSTQHYFVGRRRGQTQSQYLNFGSSNEPGKAEAEFTAEGSRAVVTGNSGMGQAQSQSGTSDCGDCRTQEQTVHYAPPSTGDLGAEIYAPGSISGSYPQAEIKRPGGETLTPPRPSGPTGQRPGFQQQPGGPFGQPPTGVQSGIQGPSANLGYNGRLIPGQGPAGAPTFGGERFPVSQTGISEGFPSRPRNEQVRPGVTGIQQGPTGPTYVNGQYPRVPEGQPIQQSPGFTTGGLPPGQPGVTGVQVAPSGPGFAPGGLPPAQIGVTGVQGAPSGPGFIAGGLPSPQQQGVSRGQQQPYGPGFDDRRQPVQQQGQFTGSRQPGIQQSTGQFPLTGGGQLPISSTGIQGPGTFITTQPGVPPGQYPTQVGGEGPYRGQSQRQPGIQPGAQGGQINGRVPTQLPAGPSQSFVTNGAGGNIPVVVQGQVGEAQRGQFSGQFAGNYVPDAGRTGQFSGTFAGQYENQPNYNGQYGSGQQIIPQGGVGQYGSGYGQGPPAAGAPSSSSQFRPGIPGGQFVQGPTNGRGEQIDNRGQFAPGIQNAGVYTASDQAGAQGGVITGETAQSGGVAARPGYIPAAPTYGTDFTGGYGPAETVQGVSRPAESATGEQYSPGYTPGVQGPAYGTVSGPGAGQIAEGGYGPSVGQGQYVAGYPGQTTSTQFRPGSPQVGPGVGGSQLEQPTGGAQFGPGVGGSQFGQPTGGTQFGPGIGGTQLGQPTGGTQFGPNGADTQLGQPAQYGTVAGTTQNGAGGSQFGSGSGPGAGGTQFGAGAGNGHYRPDGGVEGTQYGPGAVGPQQFPDQSLYGPGQVPGPLQQFGANGQTIGQDHIYHGEGGYEVAGGVSDDSDSEAQSSVQQVNNETQASASAQGKFGGGTAQSQVQGSYFGTGSFTASAGTNDGRRGAQTLISGGDAGVMSSAQGTGGLGQSQAQVSLSSETGETTSNAQSGGYNHGTNSQVQANEKGGMADAQANGPGSTSSQAQIGFTPYNENDTDDQETPFKGGGSASAQGGTYSGQSQSQITGKFRFGIKYTGSAQSQSGSSPSAPGNQTYFKPFTPISFPNISRQTHSSDRQNFSASQFNKNLKKPSSTTLRYEATETKISQQVTTEVPHEPEYYDDNDYEDYEDEEKHKIGTKSITQTSGNQKQHIILDPLEDLDATVHQAHGNDELQHGTILQPGQHVPGSSGYRIPQGFRGKVISLANGFNTAALGPNSQAQSVTLKPGSGRVIYNRPLYQLGSRTHLYNGNYGYGSGYTYQPATYKLKSGKSLPNFVAITKSETGSQDLYTGKKTPSVYYSQSSTCGYFTNTCVFNGRTKVCTPKPKTNPDGSPVIC